MNFSNFFSCVVLQYYNRLSPPIPLRLYTLPYWSNRPLLIFDIRALWRSRVSARAPKCQKMKNGRLDQYGAGPFEQQQFGTAGVEGVNSGSGEKCGSNPRIPRGFAVASTKLMFHALAALSISIFFAVLPLKILQVVN